jgi:hypothetical protein
MRCHRILPEIQKQFLSKRNSAKGIFQRIGFSPSVFKKAGVDDICCPFLDCVIGSDLNSHLLNFHFLFARCAFLKFNRPLLMPLADVFEKPEKIVARNKKDIILQILFFKILIKKIPLQEKISLRGPP